MLVKFHARGAGSAGGPLGYLLGEFGTKPDGVMPSKAEQSAGVGRRSVAPIVLAGNVEHTRELINSNKFASKYVSGVLSFAESPGDVTRDQREQVMRSFEQAMFPGLDSNQYDCLWIEHGDKGRLELNFVIPTTELSTGKRLQVYYHGADQKRVDTWKQLTNQKFGFVSPDDPSRRQAVSLSSKNLPKSVKEIQRKIHEHVKAFAASGQCSGRDDVIKFLESAGFEITRQTKSSISVANPDGVRPVRLTGELFSVEFDGRSTPELRAKYQAPERASGEVDKALLKQYREMLGVRAETLQKRYSKPLEEDIEAANKVVRDIASISSSTRADHEQHQLVAVAEDPKPAPVVEHSAQPIRVSANQRPDSNMYRRPIQRTEEPEQRRELRSRYTDISSEAVTHDIPEPPRPSWFKRARARIAEAIGSLKQAAGQLIESAQRIGHAAPAIERAGHAVSRNLRSATTAVEQLSRREWTFESLSRESEQVAQRPQVKDAVLNEVRRRNIARRSSGYHPSSAPTYKPK